MPRFPVVFLWALSGTFLLGASDRTYRIKTVSSYKRIESKHFSLLFSGISVLEAREIVKQGKLFFEDIQNEWSFELSHAKLLVTLTVNRNSDYVCDYNSREKKGYLTIPRYDLNQIRAPLERVLIIALLNRGKNRIPVFFQTGLSLFFSEQEIPDSLAIAMTLYRHPQIPFFLKEPPVDPHKLADFENLSLLYISKMWSDRRSRLIKCIHGLLKGQKARTAMRNSGLGNMDSSLKDFQSWARTQYPISKFYLFPSFWSLLSVVLMLIFIVWHFYHSWEVSGLIHEEIASTRESEDHSIQFSGVAFSGSLKEMDTGNESETNTDPVHHPKKPPDIVLDHKIHQAVQEIENDLDSFFDRSSKPKKEKQKDPFEDLDNQLDDFFDF